MSDHSPYDSSDEQARFHAIRDRAEMDVDRLAVRRLRWFLVVVAVAILFVALLVYRSSKQTPTGSEVVACDMLGESLSAARDIADRTDSEVRFVVIDEAGVVISVIKVDGVSTATVSRTDFAQPTRCDS